MITNNNSKYYKNRYKFLFLKDLELNPAFDLIGKYLAINVNENMKPVLVFDEFNMSFTLFKDVSDLKIEFSLDENFKIESYLYLSKYNYNNFQFMYLVDYYCHSLYKKFIGLNIQLKK